MSVPVPTSELRDYLAKTGKALQTMTRLVKAIETLEKSPVDNVYRIEKLVGEVQKATAGLPPDGETKRKVDTWLSACVSRLQTHKGELREPSG